MRYRHILVSRAAALVRTARQEARLTQSELSRRAGTTQSVIARMESPMSNPTVSSLEQVLAAVDRSVELTPAATLPSVDRTQIVEQLRLSPAQRLTRHDASQSNARALVRTARRVAR